MMNNCDTDEWLQMNFPVGAGPEIIVGGDCQPSKQHYMKIEFPTESPTAYFIISETPHSDGIRTREDTPVVAFSMSDELLLKIVRTIAVSKGVTYNEENW
jgi:hypothetical protein